MRVLKGVRSRMYRATLWPASNVSTSTASAGTKSKAVAVAVAMVLTAAVAVAVTEAVAVAVAAASAQGSPEARPGSGSGITTEPRATLKCSQARLRCSASTRRSVCAVMVAENCATVARALRPRSAQTDEAASARGRRMRKSSRMHLGGRTDEWVTSRIREGAR